MVQEVDKWNLLYKMGNYTELVAEFSNNESQLEESKAKWNENTCKENVIDILNHCTVFGIKWMLPYRIFWTFPLHFFHKAALIHELF